MIKLFCDCQALKKLFCYVYEMFNVAVIRSVNLFEVKKKTRFHCQIENHVFIPYSQLFNFI